MRSCPRCGQENPDHARFCLACGAALDSAPSREERKVVSILFVDLVGFTASAESADPEDVRALLRPYHERVREEIERFGGKVEKFAGDAVMAVFGAPVAHEDDAERAVRAGLGVLAVVGELGLDVRAAVNSGEAVVAMDARPERGEALVAGDVVNTAARLQGAAPVGSLVVGAETFGATKQAIDFESLEPVTVKGKAKPLPLWRALAPHAPQAVHTTSRPFFGRADELALLRQTFERTVRESHLQLVTIVGEPGAGKSRLVAEFRRGLPAAVRWRHGRCLSYGAGITFWALGEIVKAEAGILESDSPVQAEAKLAGSVASVRESERDWMLTRLLPLVGAESTGGAAGRTEAFAAWRAFLEHLAEAGPIVVVVEDLHWADKALNAFLDELVDRTADVPLLLICTARPELFEQHPAWGGGKRNSTTLSLPPLSPADTERLVGAFLEETLVGRDRIDALVERSGGNPLFAEEFARLVVDSTDTTEVSIPQTVHALISARIDTLSPEHKALIHDAAVHGRVFWSGALAAMGDRSEADVREALQHIAQKELVRRALATSVENEVEYAFWHALVRDVAYAQIPRSQRIEKHRSAAAWIERLAGERVADHAEFLVYHYESALELARAAKLDDEASALAAELGRTLILAGDRARALDLDRALTMYRRATELLTPATREHGVALARLAKAYFWAAKFEDADGAYAKAIRALQAGGHTQEAGEALAERSFVAQQRGDSSGAREHVREAIALLEPEPPGPALAAAYAYAARNEMMMLRPIDGIEWARKAIPLADRFGIDEHSVRARQFLGCCRCVNSDFGGLADLEESLRLALERGLGYETATAYENLAHMTWYERGAQVAHELILEAIELSDRRGLVQQARWDRGELAKFFYDLGRWDEILDLAGDVDEPVVWATALIQLYAAAVLAARGDIDAAGILCEPALAFARACEDPQILAPGLAVAAAIGQQRGDAHAAASSVSEFALLTAPVIIAQELAPISRVCRAIAARTSLAELMDRADQAATRSHAAALSAAGALAELDDDRDSAAIAYEEAAAAWNELSVPFERAHALLGLGRRRAAREPVEEARSLFNELGAKPSAAEADALLDATASTAEHSRQSRST